ncbi:TPA: hypothetical protein N3O60_005656, partial [Klebsiella variicola subsp. variicola]|nr:hypothetical protein [Klebsiella variicola subsp. variicola]HCM6633371.1 hypothetical protein [Klebsiella variicola subsp. variicola]
RPLKSLANRTRYLKGKADKSDVLVAEKVSAVKTFAEGATLESPRDEILYGAYRLVWTGAFPKTVPAASTPDTTGGVGAGLWAYTSDAVIRRNLASSDGLKWIGRCSDLTALRGIEPTSASQRISTVAHSPGWAAIAGVPSGGGEFYYDHNDTTSPDDGGHTIVTALGA